MDDDDSADLVRVNSWLQATVPSVPKCVAVCCLVLNVVLPGSGTITGGLTSCCCGRPRYEFRPAKHRCATALLVVMIGLAQFVSTAFMLVGWLWSIIWGILMVNLSGEEFRRSPSPPPNPHQAVKETKPEVAAASTNEDAEDDKISTGKKNFMRLIAKAADNKEQAMHGPSVSQSSGNFKSNITLQSHESIEKVSSSNVKSAAFLQSNESRGEKKSLGKNEAASLNNGDSASTVSSAVAAAADDASLAAGKEETNTTGSLSSKYSIFGRFRGQENTFMSQESFIKMIRGDKDSRFSLLSGEISPTLNSLRARGEEIRDAVRRFFTHWRNRALVTPKERLKTVSDDLESVIQDESSSSNFLPDAFEEPGKFIEEQTQYLSASSLMDEIEDHVSFVSTKSTTISSKSNTGKKIPPKTKIPPKKTTHVPPKKPIDKAKPLSITKRNAPNVAPKTTKVTVKQSKRQPK